MINKLLIGILILFVVLTPIIYLTGYEAGKTRAKIKTIEKVVYIQKEAAKNTKEIDELAKETKERIINAEKNIDCASVLNFDISKCLY